MVTKVAGVAGAGDVAGAGVTSSIALVGVMRKSLAPLGTTGGAAVAGAGRGVVAGTGRAGVGGTLRAGDGTVAQEMPWHGLQDSVTSVQHWICQVRGTICFARLTLTRC